jgi:mannose-6-phosphate isomerase-like protein (cupin superfamily)
MRTEPLWFLGTLVRTKIGGDRTQGRFSLQEGLLPRGAAPPLHSHPRDETLYLLDGEVTFWIVEPEPAEDRSWVHTHPRRCGPGTAVFAPAGTPQSFRVESETARMLYPSTPAGIEDFVHALSEPARWPWLQPPVDGSRVPPERLAAIEREHGVVRHSPPPPTAESKEER